MENITGDKEPIENERSLIKYIYQLETLYSDRQILRKELEELIKSAFNTSFNRVKFQRNTLYTPRQKIIFTLQVNNDSS